MGFGMSVDIQKIVEEQPDIVKAKLLNSNEVASSFLVIQLLEGKKRKQLVRVIHNISNHYAVKREKDLLLYLNQFPEMVHFNEIRKVGFHYLQFFNYVGKQTLTKFVKKRAGLVQSSAHDFLKDMVNVLKNIHAAGFVHADICPDNIIVGKEKYYLVSWFKSIPTLSSYETECMPEQALYCAPERLNGELDEKSDVYTLGCTLYYALTGKHIYRLKPKHSYAQQLWAHVHHTVHKMNKLPIFWRYLVFWMTQRSPEKRPTIAELEQWLEDKVVPEWVRHTTPRVDKTYPDDPLTVLADQHYLYPIYVKAKQYEQNGDLESAFNLFENGAFRGYSLAEERLGELYEEGRPVEQSYTMAANMYDQAFAKGNPNAAYHLARLFEKGLGMPPNLEYAFKLYRHSATRGHVEAQNALAEMYLKGRGTLKNMPQARSWLSLAANNGSKEAEQTIRFLIKESKQAS